MGTGGATTAARDERGATNKPRWWGVLAVSLALMALVAALSAPSRQGTVRRSGRPLVSSPTPDRPPRPAAAGPVAEPATGTVPTTTTVATNGHLPPAAAVVASGGLGPGAASGTAVSPTSAPPSSTPVSSPPAASTTGTTATPAAPTTTPSLTTERDPGNLEYPDNVSAQYPVDSGGGASVVADFSGAAVLDLSVTCPGGHADRDGASGVSVSVGGPAGRCTVEVSEPTPQSAPVSYTLTVQYPPS